MESIFAQCGVRGIKLMISPVNARFEECILIK